MLSVVCGEEFVRNWSSPHVWDPACCRLTKPSKSVTVTIVGTMCTFESLLSEGPVSGAGLWTQKGTFFGQVFEMGFCLELIWSLLGL